MSINYDYFSLYPETEIIKNVTDTKNADTIGMIGDKKNKICLVMKFNLTNLTVIDDVCFYQTINQLHVGYLSKNI